jgi:hypothetical protein
MRDRNVEMNHIMLAEYPALNEVTWDNHAKKITEKEAFFYYETRWGYIDQNNMAKEEIALIKRLTKEYGKGIFMAA